MFFKIITGTIGLLTAPIPARIGSGVVTAANTQMGVHDRGIRSLSRAEWEDRKKKGLCFKCGQVYSPSHKCPAGSLLVLLLGDDEWDERVS
ncbi:hypothetical protein HanIR_Chr12g0575491 [Helianthus annuus]|nr:hypothetical protein HanIR_Chr12g0575491 [Helianthus annuus]